MDSHIQPQFFLRGFQTKKESPNHDDAVYVYKKGMDFITEGTRKETNPSKTGVENAAYESDFYAYEKDDGTVDVETYERKLTHEVENPANHILNRLRMITLAKNQVMNFGDVITAEERKIFARYIVGMSARSKSSREMHDKSVYKSAENAERNGYSYTQLTKHLEPEEKKEFDIQWKKIEGRSQRTDGAVELSAKLLDIFRERAIKGESYPKGIFSLVDFVEPYILRMKWKLRILPRFHKMFTGDNPVYWTDLNQPAAYLYFPLATNVIFCGYNHQGFSENIYLDTDYKFLLELRKNFARKCSQLYFCERAEWLVDFFNRY